MLWSAVYLSGPGYEDQVILVHLTSKPPAVLSIPKLTTRPDSSVRKGSVPTDFFSGVTESLFKSQVYGRAENVTW